jgi:hypothetical protein
MRLLRAAAALIVVGSLAAGCSSATKSAISNLPSKAASAASGLPTRPPASPTAPAEPTTEAPTTEAPTPQPTTEPATTSAPAAQPTSSAAPASSSSNNLVWLWVVLAAIVLIAVIVWVARSSGRRSAAAAAWRSRVIDAYARGSALYDAMSVAEATGGRHAADAGARLSDIQRRADDYAQTLYALRESAPDEDARDRVADALAALQAVRSAIEAEHGPGGAGPQHAEAVRARLAFFEASIRALRGADERMP